MPQLTEPASIWPGEVPGRSYLCRYCTPISIPALSIFVLTLLWYNPFTIQSFNLQLESDPSFFSTESTRTLQPSHHPQTWMNQKHHVFTKFRKLSIFPLLPNFGYISKVGSYGFPLIKIQPFPQTVGLFCSGDVASPSTPRTVDPPNSHRIPSPLVPPRVGCVWLLGPPLELHGSPDIRLVLQSQINSYRYCRSSCSNYTELWIWEVRRDQ